MEVTFASEGGSFTTTLHGSVRFNPLGGWEGIRVYSSPVVVSPITDANGRASIYFYSTKAGTFTPTATIPGVAPITYTVVV